ncbi:MAG: YdcF family protein [Actinomycetota bacterium]|nr:YdcF family protein [Actinomycetota bacterium]
MRRTRAALAVLLVVWLTATGVLFVWPRQDEPAAADAVIVLSGGRKTRLAKGLDLVNDGVAETLVISDGRARGWTEANRLCDGGRSFRVVCFKPDPYSTHGEAVDIAGLARRRGWRSLVVVTSRYHVTRARMLFRRCTDARIEGVAARTPPLSMAMNLPFEWGKFVWQVTVERDC